MESKVTISKKFGRDVVVVIEANSAINAKQAAKDAVEALQSIKVK